MAIHYPVCDLFVSLQGEGYWSGRPMAFVRFSGCPLSCAWCDEPLHRDPTALRLLTAQEILTELQRLAPDLPHLLLTGGEPLAVPHLEPLIAVCKQAGYWVAMESSGVGAPPPSGLDWLTLSPKTSLPDSLFRVADELKYVLGPEEDAQQEEEIRYRAASHPLVWLQPRARGDEIDPVAVARCLRLVQALPTRLRLSVQWHKWIAIP